MARNRGHRLMEGQPQPKPTEDLRHGGPGLEAVLICLDKVLPFPGWMIRRIVWVMCWSFTAAPTCIWDALEESVTKRQLPQELLEVTTTDTISCQPVTNAKAWWQKTFGLPTAIAFYYFLYDYLAEPIVDLTGCCATSWLTTTVGVGILLCHFVTAVGLEKCNKRRQQRAALVEQEAAALSETNQVKCDTTNVSHLIADSAQPVAATFFQQRMDLADTAVSVSNIAPMNTTEDAPEKKSWFKKIGRKSKKPVLGTSTNINQSTRNESV